MITAAAILFLIAFFCPFDTPRAIATVGMWASLLGVLVTYVR